MLFIVVKCVFTAIDMFYSRVFSFPNSRITIIIAYIVRIYFLQASESIQLSILMSINNYD